MNTYTIKAGETFVELSATYHACQVPLSSLSPATAYVQCDPRGVYWYTSTPSIDVLPVVPEPGTWLLLVIGLAMISLHTKW